MADSPIRTGDGSDSCGASVDPITVAEAWDEGLAPQRTQLAWGRTGLAVAVAVAVLARRAWALEGAFGVVALGFVGLGGLLWMVGMRESRDNHLLTSAQGLKRVRGFGLVTSGTLSLAVGAAMLGLLLQR